MALTNDQITFAHDFDTQRSELVRSLRKASDRFSDEMMGPEAVAASRIYRAAAELVDTVGFNEFLPIAEATVPGDVRAAEKVS